MTPNPITDEMKVEQIDRLAAGLFEVIAAHRLQERTAIVAWLRAHEHSGLVEPFDEAADAIERGDHLTPTEGENHG